MLLMESGPDVRADGVENVSVLQEKATCHRNGELDGVNSGAEDDQFVFVGHDTTKQLLFLLIAESHAQLIVQVSRLSAELAGVLP